MLARVLKHYHYKLSMLLDHEHVDPANVILEQDTHVKNIQYHLFGA